MSDADIRDLQRVFETTETPEAEFAYLLALQRTQKKPWAEIATFAWCRACHKGPELLVNDDDIDEERMYLRCRGLYQSRETPYLTHNASKRYQMEEPDGHWCCNGTPCKCDEICPGWKWAINV